MASVALRRTVCSIVGASKSNTTTVTANTVTRELVPHKFEMLTAAQAADPKLVAQAFERMQRNVDDATKSARSLPHLGGAYWPDVAFAANTIVTIVHGLGEKVAWQVASLRPSGLSPSGNTVAVTPMQIVEVKQDVTNGRLQLAASANCTADLLILPKPEASR